MFVVLLAVAGVPTALSKLIAETAATGSKHFDSLYETADDFPGLYETIIDKLIREAKQHRTIVYAVPGSPTTGETTATLLRDKAAENGVELEIH